VDVFKFLIIYISVGIMLYIGGFKAADHDIIDMIFDISGDQVRMNESFAGETFPTKTNESVSTVGFNILNPLDFAWGFVLFLYNITFYPLAIANTLGLPLPLKLFAGAFGAYFIFSVVKFVRG